VAAGGGGHLLSPCGPPFETALRASSG
jgi:hypothetical protein